MTPREIAISFFDEINSGRFDEAFARLAPDVRYEVISPAPYGGLMDRAGLGEFVAKYVTPRLTGPMVIDVLGVTAESDRVSIETRVNAPGKDGKDYVNRFHFLFVVRDTQIVEVREYLNSAVFIDFVRP